MNTPTPEPQSPKSLRPVNLPSPRRVTVIVSIVVIILLASIGLTIYQLKQQGNQRIPVASTTGQILTPTQETSLAQDDSQEGSVSISPDWQTFSNERLQLKFSYPKSWFRFGDSMSSFIALSTKEIKELPPDGPSGEITAAINECTNTVTNEKFPCDKSISERIANVRDNFTRESFTITDKFQVGGKIGAQVSGIFGPGPYEGLKVKDTFVPFGDYLLLFTLYGEGAEQIYDQILSTIKFVIPDQEKLLIDSWLQENNLNQYGDPKDTMYAGGTPLFDERTGERTDRYDYIVKNHPEKPWSR